MTDAVPHEPPHESLHVARDIALDVTGVGKRFGSHTVLDGVDLRATLGSVTAVLGPSGSGKTTLLRIIAGFESLDTGSVTVSGVRVAAGAADGALSMPPERRRIGIVPQEGALFPHLDVAGNVGFGLPRNAEAAQRVAELLDLVGLAGMQRQRPDRLSGGQQQRVALARALAPRPALVMLDEPFSALDASLRSRVRDDVFEVIRSEGATAVLVTHDQQEALSVADQVAVLLDGRIAQSGTASELYERPASLAVATFVGDATALPGVAAGGQVRTVLGSLPLSNPAVADGPVTVVVRPEQVSVTAPPRSPSDNSSAAATGEVVSRAFFGHDALIRVRLVDGTIVESRQPAGGLPERGSDVSVAVVGSVTAFSTT